jgi:hypothetical protein
VGVEEGAGGCRRRLKVGAVAALTSASHAAAAAAGWPTPPSHWLAACWAAPSAQAAAAVAG